MKYTPYPMRDAIKNYFPLPNELFILGLGSGEISVYSYLIYLENRDGHQCWPSYKTIGKAVSMSQNTVRKYVLALEEKGLIRTEPTTVYTKSGEKLNGSLLYTIRPIQEALDFFTPDRWHGRPRILRNSVRQRSWQSSPVSAPVSRCVGLWDKRQEQPPPRARPAKLGPFGAKMRGRKKKQDKGQAS